MSMQTASQNDKKLYGIIAEFNAPEEIIDAANKAREAGYKKMDAYTPFPVHHLDDALGFQQTRLGWVVLFAGIVGALGGFFLQWYANVVFYPLNIGGKPLNSWPNFVVITFECAVLFSAFAAGLFMIIRNGLPRLHHPIFGAHNFAAATRDKFFLCIEARDAKFDTEQTRQFLEQLNPNHVSDVKDE